MNKNIITKKLHVSKDFPSQIYYIQTSKNIKPTTKTISDLLGFITKMLQGDGKISFVLDCTPIPGDICLNFINMISKKMEYSEMLRNCNVSRFAIITPSMMIQAMVNTAITVNGGSAHSKVLSDFNSALEYVMN
jgi:hypothetical protein